jgi:hypothetical protein
VESGVAVRPRNSISEVTELYYETQPEGALSPLGTNRRKGEGG